MCARAFRLTCLMSLLLAAPAALAQEGQPAKGTWVGYWGPTLTVESRIVLVIDHDGKTMSGVFQPGPNAVPLKVARLDITPGTPATRGRGNTGNTTPPILPIFKVYFEIDARDAGGNPIAIVAEGTMHNVALPNRSITGTWTRTSGGNTVKSEFKIARQ